MIDADQFNDRYFGWLKEQAFATPQRASMYEGVLRVLFEIPFYWTMISDENRAGDASVYRGFERHMLDQERHNISSEWLDQWENAAPSVLEVLIGISERWSQYFELPTSYYFNHLFRNLGFHTYTGPGMRPSQKEAIRWILDIWMSRQFMRDGEGSPFPIEMNRFSPDMRTLDIWGQMNEYSRQHFQ